MRNPYYHEANFTAQTESLSVTTIITMYNVQANLTINIDRFEIDKNFIMVTLVLSLHK